MTKPHSSERPTILVVEDEPLLRNMLVKILVRKNYEVLEAASAVEALEVSRSFDGVISLLIADHTLKTMTGRQVAEVIQKSRPDVKVIHISGYSIEKLEEEGGLMPGAEFLAKPFSPLVLAETVNQILGGPEWNMSVGSSKTNPGSLD